MSDTGYKIRNEKEIHFITFAVVEWVDAFTRNGYRDIVIDSLRHCQEEKGLKLYDWCIMSNHVHLLVRAKNENLSDILRDFKKFTSRQIIKAIEQNEGESRKDWMLKIFKEHGEKNSRNKECQFWRQDSQPKECYSPKFSLQKLNYIHNNSVEAGIVDKAEEYLYSSASDYHYGKNVELLEIEFL
jgi:REP element-mobilizing transposase RayT